MLRKKSSCSSRVIGDKVIVHRIPPRHHEWFEVAPGLTIFFFLFLYLFEFAAGCSFFVKVFRAWRPRKTHGVPTDNVVVTLWWWWWWWRGIAVIGISLYVFPSSAFHRASYPGASNGEEETTPRGTAARPVFLLFSHQGKRPLSGGNAPGCTLIFTKNNDRPGVLIEYGTAA